MLKPDDFEVGQLVLVVRGKLMKGQNHFGEPIYVEDSSLNGWVFKIKAIDLPWVAFEFVCSPIALSNEIKPFALNIADYKFKKPNEEYIKALTGSDKFSNTLVN